MRERTAHAGERLCVNDVLRAQSLAGAVDRACVASAKTLAHCALAEVGVHPRDLVCSELAVDIVAQLREHFAASKAAHVALVRDHAAFIGTKRGHQS